MEVFDELHVYRAKSHVFNSIFVLQEVVQMFSCGQISDIGMVCAVDPHTLGVLLVMLVKKGQKMFFGLSLPRNRVLYDLSRDVPG